MFSWIPIVGPIIDGIVSMFSKWQDTKLGTYKVDGQVVSTEIKASADTTIAFKDDIGVRLSRDIIMFPGSCYCGIYIWDKIMDLHHPELVWGVAPLDGLFVALPTMLFGFFFGVAVMNIWKR